MDILHSLSLFPYSKPSYKTKAFGVNFNYHIILLLNYTLDPGQTGCWY